MKRPRPTTLTAKDLAFFQKEVSRLIGVFGLKDWDATFELADLGTSYAYTYMHWKPRKIHYRLNKNYPAVFNKTLKEHLLETAKHEVIHHLLAPITCIGVSRWSTEDEMDSAEHEVVGKLLQLL